MIKNKVLIIVLISLGLLCCYNMYSSQDNQLPEYAHRLLQWNKNKNSSRKNNRNKNNKSGRNSKRTYTSSKSTYTKPTVRYVPSRSTYVKPAYVKPAYVKPAYVKPAYVKPAYVKPAYVPPAYVRPAYVPPAYVAPKYIPPAYTAPKYVAPAANKYVAQAYVAPKSSSSYSSYRSTYQSNYKAPTYSSYRSYTPSNYVPNYSSKSTYYPSTYSKAPKSHYTHDSQRPLSAEEIIRLKQLGEYVEPTPGQSQDQYIRQGPRSSNYMLLTAQQQKEIADQDQNDQDEMLWIFLLVFATTAVLSILFAIGYITYDKKQRTQAEGEHVNDITRVEVLTQTQDVFEKAVAEGQVAVGTVVSTFSKGKYTTIEGEEEANGEVPMKGKKCSANDIRFNRIAPRQKKPQRRQTESSSSSDEENAGQNACYGAPVVGQGGKGEGMGLFDQQPNDQERQIEVKSKNKLLKAFDQNKEKNIENLGLPIEMGRPSSKSSSKPKSKQGKRSDSKYEEEATRDSISQQAKKRFDPKKKPQQKKPKDLRRRVDQKEETSSSDSDSSSSVSSDEYDSDDDDSDNLDPRKKYNETELFKTKLKNQIKAKHTTTLLQQPQEAEFRMSAQNYSSNDNASNKKKKSKK